MPGSDLRITAFDRLSWCIMQYLCQKMCLCATSETLSDIEPSLIFILSYIYSLTRKWVVYDPRYNLMPHLAATNHFSIAINKLRSKKESQFSTCLSFQSCVPSSHPKITRIVLHCKKYLHKEKMISNNRIQQTIEYFVRPLGDVCILVPSPRPLLSLRAS